MSNTRAALAIYLVVLVAYATRPLAIATIPAVVALVVAGPIPALVVGALTAAAVVCYDAGRGR